MLRIGSRNRLQWFAGMIGISVWTVFLPFGYGQVPANFYIESFIASGLTFPTAMEFLPDGSMLITEFSGKIFMVPPGATQINSTSVLQLKNIYGDKVNLGGERGLSNIIADPNFSTNHYFYVFYTA